MADLKVIGPTTGAKCSSTWNSANLSASVMNGNDSGAKRIMTDGLLSYAKIIGSIEPPLSTPMRCPLTRPS